MHAMERKNIKKLKKKKSLFYIFYKIYKLEITISFSSSSLLYKYRNI